MKKIDKDATPKPDANAEPAEDKPAKNETCAADAPVDVEACKKKADEEAEAEDPLAPKKENVEALGKKNIKKAIKKMKGADPKDYSYAKRNQKSNSF